MSILNVSEPKYFDAQKAYLIYRVKFMEKLIAKLRDGEWSQTIVRGPNPTGFCSDETQTIRDAAEALEFMVKKLKLLEKAEMFLKTSEPEASGFYFIAGAMGEVDRNSLPEKLLICPAYGCDWTQIYERTDRATGPEW
jgi:hypothetical protein